MFRDKNQQQLSELFRHHQRHCSCFSTGPPCPHGNGEGQEETLAQTIQRLTIRHDEVNFLNIFLFIYFLFRRHESECLVSRHRQQQFLT